MDNLIFIFSCGFWQYWCILQPDFLVQMAQKVDALPLPIHEIFTKKYWELEILKNVVFLSRPFWIFIFKKKHFFAFFPWKQVKFYWLARTGQNFDQAKRDNSFWPRPNILPPSVCTITLNPDWQIKKNYSRPKAAQISNSEFCFKKITHRGTYIK